MAETEVETILREIRERVLAGQRAAHDVAAANQPMNNDAHGGNSVGELSSGGQLASPADSGASAAGNLSLINSYLTTTARAWDRLPPVVSNRSGLVARVELWLKRNLKRATRWYSWEQVNFNAAVHHALRDLLPAFAAYEVELRKLRAQLAAAETRAEARAKELAQTLTAQSTAQASELQALNRAHETRNHQVEAQLAALVSELRERVQHLQDEQRVCYKQLALETTEAAVLEDRARRKTEALLEELQRRVEKLET